MDNLNERIFELNAEGLTAGKIAQKLKVKKAQVLDILGEAANKGAGDKVEQITEALGIKAVVEQVFGDDCGCKARKEVLNKLFPNRKLNDLLNDQYEWLDKFFEVKRSSVSPKEQLRLVEIYNHVFRAKRTVSSCGTCVAHMIDELLKVYGKAAESSND